MIDNLYREWKAADEASARLLRDLWFGAEHYTVAAADQNLDSTEHFIVAGSGLALDGPWAEERAAAIHLRLDPDERTCHARMAHTLTYGWAGHWLVRRGADPDALARYRPLPADPYNWGPGGYDYKAEGLIAASDYWCARPGDARTRTIEDRIRRSGDRYRILTRQLAYPGCATDEDQREAHCVLLQDSHPRAAERRYVVQLETVHRLRAVYTLDEGGFRTEREAQEWLDRIDPRRVAPLPATDPSTGLPATPRHPASSTAPAAFRPPPTPGGSRGERPPQAAGRHAVGRRATVTPQAEAEQALLGALLLSPAQLASVASWLKPGHFYRPTHAALYEVLLAQQKAGHPALEDDEPETRWAWALEAMETAATSCPSFTPSYGHTLISACPTADHALAYGRMVLETAVRREIHEHAHRLQAATRDADTDAVLRLTAELHTTIDRLGDAWGSFDGRPVPAPGQWPLELSEDAARSTLHQEEALLASLSAAPSELAELVRWLCPDDLLDPGHQAVYRALAALGHRGEPIDPLTVLWEVQHRGALTTGTLTADRVRTVTRAGYRGESGYWAEQVLRAALLRTTAARAGAVRLLALDASVPAARLLGSALHVLRDAETVQGRWRTATGLGPPARGDPAPARHSAARTRTRTPAPAAFPASAPSPAQMAAQPRAPVRSTY